VQAKGKISTGFGIDADEKHSSIRWYPFGQSLKIAQANQGETDLYLSWANGLNGVDKIIVNVNATPYSGN
jgi:hypothetical protein